MILKAFSTSKEKFRMMCSPVSCCFGGCHAEAAPQCHSWMKPHTCFSRVLNGNKYMSLWLDVTYEGVRVSAWSASHCCGAIQGSDGYARNDLPWNVQLQLSKKISGTIDLLHNLEIFSLALAGYLGKDSSGRMDQAPMYWACISFHWPLGYCCSGVSAQGRSLDLSQKKDGVLQPHYTMEHLA